VPFRQLETRPGSERSEAVKLRLRLERDRLAYTAGAKISGEQDGPLFVLVGFPNDLGAHGSDIR
jgi:hypothetical protein